MKNTSNAQKWACDVVTDTFDQDFLDQLRLLTNSEILLVPRRLKGITSGQNGRCYWNANICAQTWGGDVVYGWSIMNLPRSNDGSMILFGHACWLTPEGNLVDTTYHPARSQSFFLPSSEKLVLNAKATELMADFYFATSRKSLDQMLTIAAKRHANCIDGSNCKDYFVGNGIVHEKFLGKVSFLDAFPSNLCAADHFEFGSKYWHDYNAMYSPYACVVSADIFKKIVHDPCLALEVMGKRAIAKQQSILKLYAGYSVTAEWMGSDMVWDSEGCTTPSLPNSSLQTGKTIQEIPPRQELVDKHSRLVPTQKKHRKKVDSISDRYKLSPAEVMMLSNPFLYPHPYLLNKVGWERVPRIHTKDMIFI